MPTRPLSNEELEKTLRVYAECGHKQNDTAKALNISRSALQNRLRHARPSQTADRTIMSAAQTAVKGRSLDEFRATHDKSYVVPKKIKEALKQLGTGWEYEVQFCKIAGISLADLGNFRDAFAEHIVVVRRDGKRAWAGTQAVAAKMREMVS